MLPEAVGVMMIVVEAFDRLHIPYLIGGSMASALHGVTRSTIDADMVPEIEPDQKAFVATAEDTILAKLEWYRLGGEVSDRQWRDILGVFIVQAGRLDLDYLQKWAAELNVTDLLQKAMKESD
jgi:hypothetical protein